MRLNKKISPLDNLIYSHYRITHALRITLAVVCGSAPGDMNTALWRSGDVIFGSLLALIFTSVYPQRAFTHLVIM